MTLSTMVVIVKSTPIFAVVIVPILILYWFVQVKLSLSSSRCVMVNIVLFFHENVTNK